MSEIFKDIWGVFGRSRNVRRLESGEEPYYGPMTKGKGRPRIHVEVEKGSGLRGLVAKFLGLEVGAGIFEGPKKPKLAEEPRLTAEQQQARLHLIEVKAANVPEALHQLKVTKYDGASLRSTPSVFEENVIGWLNEGDIVPRAIEFSGKDPTNPDRKAVWFAFALPSDTRPLEQATIAFSYSGNFQEVPQN